MKRSLSVLFRLLLLASLPLVGQAAPPPYWQGYPPTPYYYPPLPAPVFNQNNEDTAITNSTGVPVETETPEPDTAKVKPATASVEPIPQPPPVSDAITEPSLATEEIEENSAPLVTEVVPSSEEKATNSPPEVTQQIALAIQQGNFAEAYYLWRPLAESGDADAQYGIGWMYHNGYGLAINDDKAIEWWERAAEQNHVDAKFALGMLYGLGEGEVRRDLQRAVEYYLQAARLGHEDARLLLRTLATQGEKHARQLLLELLAKGELLGIAKITSVTAEKANVRKGPSTQNKILTTTEKGQQLAMLKREGRWLLVALEGSGLFGWIHDSLVERDALTKD